MKNICIIGGSQKETFEKIGKKRGFKVLHHDGKTGGGKVEKQIISLVRKSDYLVIMMGAIKHQTMWVVRDLAESLGVPIIFHDGFGASGAFEKLESVLGAA